LRFHQHAPSPYFYPNYEHIYWKRKAEAQGGFGLFPILATGAKLWHMGISYNFLDK